MSEPTLTPREVEETLKLSAPAVRRLAVAYENVFGPLPRLRGSEGPRRWPLPALRRVQVAHEAVAAGRIGSIEDALRVIARGDDLPVKPSVEAPPDPTLDLARVVEALCSEVERLRAELANARALPAPTASSDELRQLVREEIEEALTRAVGERSQDALRAAVRAEVRSALDPERLAVVLHAAPRREPRGLMAWLRRLMQ